MPLKHSLAVADLISECDSLARLQVTIDESLRLAAICAFDDPQFAAFVNDVCLRVGVAAGSHPSDHHLHRAAELFREAACRTRGGNATDHA